MEARQANNQPKIHQAEQALNTELGGIDLRFQKSVDCLVAQYDEYMKVKVPQPQFLNVTLNVVFDFKWNVHHGQKIENIQVKPFACVKDLMAIVEARCKAKGDAITDLAMERLTFKIVGPLAKAEDEESKEQLGAMQQVILIKDVNQPWQSYKLAQNSTIYIGGGPIVFESDKPMECMSVGFKAEDQHVKYNYFSCKTCNTNWICETCRKGCHDDKGHVTLPHIQQHRPTYACCYCMKRGLCQIKNKKN
jgi:hypothetical protein